MAALASAGLPAGAAAALNSAISSLSSGGAVPIKLPTVGLNTNDRSSATSLLGSVFGSSKIPVPNFSGNPATTGETPATAALGKIKEIETKVAELQKQIDDNVTIILSLKSDYAIKKAAFTDLKNSLPAGDPQIESTKAEVNALVVKVNDLIDVNRALRKQRDDVINSVLG